LKEEKVEKRTKSLKELKNLVEEKIQFWFVDEELTAVNYFERLFWLYQNIVDWMGIYKSEEIEKIDVKIIEMIEDVRKMERLKEALKDVLKKKV